MKYYPTRAALYRITQIHEALRDNRYPTARSLAAKMQVSPRSILRDIEYMRDVLGAKITYDSGKHGYYYEIPGFDLPSVTISEGELVALLIGAKVLRQYAGGPFEQPLRDAFRKIETLLPDEVTIRASEIAAATSFSYSAPRVEDSAKLQRLWKSVQERQRIRVSYRGLTGSGGGERLLDPYHMACVDGAWYVVAFCHRRKEVRLFVPERMEQIEVTDQHFAKPTHFNLASYMGGAFRVMRGGTPRKIRLRFEGLAGRFVAERQWHPTQRIRMLRSGGCELEMTLSNLDEVCGWVMSFGGECRVLEPADLRHRVRTGHWYGLESNDGHGALGGMVRILAKARRQGIPRTARNGRVQPPVEPDRT